MGGENLPEDIVKDVETAVFRVERKSLGKLQRVGTVVYDQHAGNEDDERVAIASRLGIAGLNFVLDLGEWQTLSMRTRQSDYGEEIEQEEIKGSVHEVRENSERWKGQDG